jgi:uncharacterized protein YbjT (DUF2867 family)
MNLTVLGAAGATGVPLVEQALAAGHRVTALVRSGPRLAIANPNLDVVEGDATDRTAVHRAMKGADAVISVLGARGPVIGEATRAVVSVARQEGPERVVMLSSFAVARDRLTPLSRLVTRMAMSRQIEDKAAGEEVLRASGLDWTIVYPTRLTNGPAAGARVVLETGKVGISQTISRADVASFLLQAATDDLYSRRGVVITAEPRARLEREYDELPDDLDDAGDALYADVGIVEDKPAELASGVESAALRVISEPATTPKSFAHAVEDRASRGRRSRSTWCRRPTTRGTA